jgi:hypothetical protein
VPARGRQCSSADAAHLCARAQRIETADRIPLVSVVTDPYYGFWKGWACDDVTLYLVASDEARRQLIDYGIAPERIKISGMPVHHKFAYPGEEAAQARARSVWIRRSLPFSSTPVGKAAATFRRFSASWFAGNWKCRQFSWPARTKSLRADAESLAETALVSRQSDWLFRTRRAVDGRRQRHDFEARRTDNVRSVRLPPADYRRRITAPMPQEAGTASLLVLNAAPAWCCRAQATLCRLFAAWLKTPPTTQRCAPRLSVWQFPMPRATSWKRSPRSFPLQRADEQVALAKVSA